MMRVSYSCRALPFLAAAGLSLLLTGSAPAQEPILYDSVNVEGTWLAYRTAGEGPPLLLLHGFMGSGRMWEGIGLLEAFALDYRVIVPDLRGRGRSVDPSDDLRALGPGQSARDMIVLLDHLGVERAHAIGLSFGAMTLLHLATDQPQRFDRLVLISGGHYLRQAAREGIRRENDPEQVPLQVMEGAVQRHGHIGGVDQVRRLFQAFHSVHADYEFLNFTPPLLSRITTPTLIVQGDRDVFFPMEVALEMYRSIPNAYLWVLPGEGHESFLNSERWLARLEETLTAFVHGEVPAPNPGGGD